MGCHICHKDSNELGSALDDHTRCDQDTCVKCSLHCTKCNIGPGCPKYYKICPRCNGVLVSYDKYMSYRNNG